MDETLSWASQVNETGRKIFASLHSLRRLQNFLPLKTKVMLARSLLIPLLDYADVACLDASEALLDKLERYQNVCIRYIFGLRKFDHISEFRNKLNWLPIRMRRNSHILSLLYSALFNPTSPVYLKEKFHFLSDSSGGRLRSSHNLALGIPDHQSHKFAKSFAMKAVVLWNSLPESVRKSQSIAVFKNNVKKHWGFTSDSMG